MSMLSNVYCLGCKTRHPEVKIDEVIEMTVKGSIRYQGKGVCENGKTWCKILKRDEIPASYLNKTPNEDVDSLSVFEKGAESVYISYLFENSPFTCHNLIPLNLS